MADIFMTVYMPQKMGIKEYALKVSGAKWREISIWLEKQDVAIMFAIFLQKRALI